MKKLAIFVVAMIGILVAVLSQTVSHDDTNLRESVMKPITDVVMISTKPYVLTSSYFSVDADLCPEVQKSLSQLQLKSLDFLYEYLLYNDVYQMYSAEEFIEAKSRKTKAERAMDNEVFKISMHDPHCVRKIRDHQLFGYYEVPIGYLDNYGYSDELIEYLGTVYNGRVSRICELWEDKDALQKYVDSQ